MPVALKRVYQPPSAKDGVRVLVDRLWPRGLTKASAQLDYWLRDLAPSNELRRWYHARPAMFEQFRRRYWKELRSPQANRALERLYEIAAVAPLLTLVYASTDETQNNATVLRDLLNGMRKPPSSSGPAQAAAIQKRARARPPRPR